MKNFNQLNSLYFSLIELIVLDSPSSKSVGDSISKKILSKNNFEWSLKKLSIILQPFVPHISEEIWSNLDNGTLCINESWVNEEVNRKIKLNIAIQINGKTAGIIDIVNNSDQKTVEKMVVENTKLSQKLRDKKTKKIIFVKNRIINYLLNK